MPRSDIDESERDRLVAHARELRRDGATAKEIAETLAIPVRGALIRRALYGQPPGATAVGLTEAECRAEAERLRRSGFSYGDISATLGVSTSTLHGWLATVELTPAAQAVLYATRAAKLTGGAAGAHRAAVARDARFRDDASAWLGALSPRELRLVGAITYWCEGSKSKPWRTSRDVHFINSDPQLIQLFIAFLREMGVGRERMTFRVSIHETADVTAAVAYWAELVGVPVADFRRTTLKRHNPRTRRRNVGTGYYGCLTIRVLRSADLYREIVGIVEAVVAMSAALPGRDRRVG
ncbi:MAG TPA: hypothetical protein VNA12_07960 [Mycobacteriales bacterium]|nr:hypothetical protein [Mycobacteriales bacterium]